MALFPLQPGLNPLGQFDVVNTELASILGGQVLTFTSVSRTNTSTESAAFDAADGYLFDTTVPINNRPASTRASTAAQFPLYLSDDGLSGYGTYFGQTIGVPAGLSTTGTNLGPHSAAASGKVTLWDKPGLYAVSTDAVATDFLTSISTGASAGLTPGTVLGFCNSTDIGKLAHNSCTLKVAGTGVGYFVEFATANTSNQTGGSLVTTPNKLVGATEIFTRVIINWFGGQMNVRTL